MVNPQNLRSRSSSASPSSGFSKRSFMQEAADDRFYEDFPMRAVVRDLGLASVRPALENLSGRKPRGLEKVYGESAMAVWVEAVATPLPRRPKPWVCAFIPCFLGGCRGNRGVPTRSLWGFEAPGTNEFGRSRRGNRSASAWMSGHGVMRPGPLVVLGTLASGRAGRSRRRASARHSRDNVRAG